MNIELLRVRKEVAVSFTLR